MRAMAFAASDRKRNFAFLTAKLKNKKTGFWMVNPEAGPRHRQPSGFDRSFFIRT
jgi:hypothetical protein